MKKLFKKLLVLLVFVIYLTPTITWAAETWNETTPASTESPTLGDDRIRELKRAIRERLAADHDFEASETIAFGTSGSTIGFHEGIRLKEQSSSPITLENVGAFWAADDGAGNTELFMRGPENDTVVQLTEGGMATIRNEVVTLLKDLTVTYTELNQLDGIIVGGTSPGDIVTIDDTQTLTNKTLTTPIVNASQLDATGDEIDKAADGIGVTIPRQKLIEIGDWNMDSTASKSVSHGLDVTKIIGVRAMIRNDSDASHFPLAQSRGDGAAEFAEAAGNISYIGATAVALYRVTGGYYDGANFDSTSYNRGWLIIDYID